MEFLVLGALAVVSDTAVPLDLGTPKARAVLAVLLCRPGRVVGVDALVDALWPEAPPTAAVKNVQLYVHQLRRALGDAGRIRRRDGGYALVADPDEIDAERFASLVDRHRVAAAVDDLDEAHAALSQALGLWRGERAYAGIGDVPPVTSQARRPCTPRTGWLARIPVASCSLPWPGPCPCPPNPMRYWPGSCGRWGPWAGGARYRDTGPRWRCPP